MDKTTNALLSAIIFIVAGGIVTLPLVYLDMGLLWGSLYPLFGALGILWYNAFRAPNPSSSPNCGKTSENVPKGLHKALVAILGIILTLGINYWQYKVGWVPLPFLEFTIGTQAIGWFWYMGLYLQVGLGLPSSEKTALRKALGTVIALTLTWITVVWCLKAAPEGVSVFLPDTIVHLLVAYAILDSNLW
ncbi:MAG: hypothetical protein QW612_05905 [Candidatus Bathyarchaeia archaeon]